MYAIDSRVRFSEVDSNGDLSWLALVDYFQDTVTEQSEVLGLGIDHLREKNLAWVLLTWQICVNRMPHLTEHVTVETHPYELKAFFGLRNFLLYGEGRELLACANSVWVLMDMENMKPVRIPQEFLEAYELSEKYPMNYFGRKLKLPKEMERQESLQVLPYFLDTNSHVNNGKYVMVAESYLPEGFKARELRAEYRTQAHLGDEIIPYVARDEEGVIVNLASASGEPFAIIRFME